MTPEQLIYELQSQVLRLESELNQAQQDILDFEKAAKIWQKSYLDMEKEYKQKIANRDQTIEELQKELKELQ